MADPVLAEGLRTITDLSGLGNSEWTDELDTAAVEMHLALADVSWPRIQAAGDAGLRIRVLIADRATGELVLETTAGGSFAVDVRGEFDQSLGGGVLRQFREACDASRPEAIVGLLSENIQADCTLWATLENKPSETGCHWIRSRLRLLAILSEPAASLALSRRLAATPDVRRLVVADATGVLVITPVLLIHGLAAWPSPPVTDWFDDAVRAYAQTFQSQWGERRLPPPIAFTPTADSGQDRELAVGFGRLAELLAWSWMSVDSRGLRFEGVRTLELGLFFPDHDNLEGALALWRWAVSSPAIDRHEALQRAITLSVFKREDLQQTAAILKNARWFLDLAQRDAVAEAMSTRRQVREAAMSTAAGVASRASDATIKAFDRVAVQIAAAVGIIFAQYKAVLDTATAARLLAVVVAMLLVSAFLSIRLDFRFIAQTLRAFKQDLQAYRETLSSDDIAGVAALESLTTAGEQNCHRWKASIVLHALVIAATLSAIGVMLQGHVLQLLP